VRRHVILIGLPGAGKTTVGRMVAERLQVPFVDVDALIERKEGKPIMMIFAEHGEAAFRTMERREVDAALMAEPSIISPGGGWAAQAGALAAARERAVVVYLKATPETATKRAGPEGNRPMLLGEDPVGRMKTLLQEREPSYKLADVSVETDRQTLEQVTAEVVRLAELRAA